MILSSEKYLKSRSNVTEIILKRSWHTQLKHFKPYMLILQKVKKPQDVFFKSSLL